MPWRSFKSASRTATERCSSLPSNDKKEKEMQEEQDPTAPVDPGEAPLEGGDQAQDSPPQEETPRPDDAAEDSPAQSQQEPQDDSQLQTPQPDQAHPPVSDGVQQDNN
jgi:hypothetical protein